MKLGEVSHNIFADDLKTGLHSISMETLALEGVHLWRAPLTADDAMRERFYAFLTAEEKKRAGRFHFVEDRFRYIVARGCLRYILGMYLNCDPCEVALASNPWSKPFLVEDGGQKSRLRFNLSHSGGMALYGLTLDREIGVDLEEMRPLDDLESMASMVFTPREIEILDSVSTAEKEEIFFRFWTRKEAVIKAVGRGLSIPLARMDVSDISHPISGMEAAGVVGSWWIADIDRNSGHAAVCMEGGLPVSWNIRRVEW